MNTKTLLSVIGLVSLLGCGNFDPTGKHSDTESNGNSSVQPLPSLAIQTQAALPGCDGASEGQLAYVITEEAFYTCATGAWTQIDVKGEKGDTGAKGDKGDKGSAGSTVDRFHYGLALYKDYRRSIARVRVTCACGSGNTAHFGTAFFCAEDALCTNVHVAACTESGCSLTSLQAQIVDAESDSVRPDNTEVTPFLSSTNPTVTTHGQKDLAKITIPSLPSGAKVLPIASGLLKNQENTTLRGILSMSFPLGFDDLYTDLGYVNSNSLDDCNAAYSCPGQYYDFSTTNDTDKGSSGSPLIDLDTGKVVGVTTAGTDGENANYTWAVDASYFHDF